MSDHAEITRECKSIARVYIPHGAGCNCALIWDGMTLLSTQTEVMGSFPVMAGYTHLLRELGVLLPVQRFG